MSILHLRSGDRVTKRMKTIVARMLGLSLLLVEIALLTGCNQPQEIDNVSFPSREIVFVISSRPEGDVLGFVHSDGTGLITQTVKPEYFINYPTWGADGKSIAFRGELIGGDYFTPLRPYVLSSGGNRLSSCNEWEWHSGRVWPTSDGKLLMAAKFAPDKRERIMLGDPTTCRAEVVFESQYIEGKEAFDSAALSTQGWLAVSQLQLQNKPAQAQLMIVDPISHEVQTVGNGLAPAWSRDGEWLAFTALDGIYIVRKDGSQQRRLLEVDSTSQEKAYGWAGDLPVVSWSPDGRYLVYSQLTSEGVAIYRLDVESGTQTVIFKGGYHPNWRWDIMPTVN